MIDHIPLGRLGTVDEVAHAVVFPASPAAGLVRIEPPRRWRLDRLVAMLLQSAPAGNFHRPKSVAAPVRRAEYRLGTSQGGDAAKHRKQPTI
jgi:NAD(P)-dependent dehydrogenase (short-subunit alcohol dehydrogenase family)